MKQIIKSGLLLIGLGSGLSWGGVIEKVDYQLLAGDNVEIRLTMDETPATPRIFKTENPASVYLDFKDVESRLKSKKFNIGAGMTRDVTTLTVGDRTRVTVRLLKMVPYQTRVEGNQFIITLGKTSIAQTSSTFNDSNVSSSQSGSGDVSISKIDFHRGLSGEGRVLLSLSDSNASIDLRQEGSKVIADFYNTSIDSELLRKLDVIDFGTPARMIETQRRGSNVRVTVSGNEQFEYVAYQADDNFTIELKPLTHEELEKRKKSEFRFTGERLNLNFQNIDVRTVLQIIANQVHFNLVASDTVQGSVTLRLENVPWDQALSIILKSKGLGQRQNGNVLMIAPTAEIVAREKLELQSEVQVEQLAPLQSQFIQINYAKAADIAALIEQGEDENSLLSGRGSVIVDDRTNKLLVQDTAIHLDDILNLVETLDISVRQVQIETRIVTATDGFSRELGVRWGLSDRNSQSGFSGSLEGAEDIANGFTPIIDDRLNVNLPLNEAAGRIGLNLARLTDGTLLDLELSALESENLGEIVASPRATTLNQQEAYIESGQELPFLEAASSGASAVQFKKAVLSLRVTPQITPDDSIILDLQVTQDAIGELTTSGPAINTKRLNTQVLVRNGETIVLGGIFQKRLNTDVTKVPVLGDLPGIGFLFRNKVKSEEKEELLIFVTPKIVKETVR